MSKRFRILLLAIGIVVAPLYLSRVAVAAPQNEVQRAHDTGYQNGVNAARQGKPMNMNTGDWHGDRLTAYQQGYREGYESVRAGGERGAYQDAEMQKAYQAGFHNGVRAREENRPMNMNTGDWHGDRLEAYRKGYEQGYRGHRDHDDLEQH